MVTQEKEQYGNWCRIEGKIEDIGDTIAEVKPLMLEHAQQVLGEQGLTLNSDSVEGIIRQGFNNADGTFFSDEEFEGSIPYVSVAWKAYAHG